MTRQQMLDACDDLVAETDDLIDGVSNYSSGGGMNQQATEHVNAAIADLEASKSKVQSAKAHVEELPA